MLGLINNFTFYFVLIHFLFTQNDFFTKREPVANIIIVSDLV